MRDTGIAYEAVTDLSFDDAVARCRSELAREGFDTVNTPARHSEVEVSE